jgi:hypothetical protein
MKHALLIVSMFALTSCSSVVETTSGSTTNEALDRRSFEGEADMISHIEAVSEQNAEDIAELAYIKAQTLSAIGEIDDARVLYTFLVDEHRTTEFGYLALVWLKENPKH